MAKKSISSAKAGGVSLRGAPPLVHKIQEALIDRKGERIELVDVRGKSTVTDYYLVVSGSTPPHLNALAVEVQRKLKEEGVHCYRRSGSPDDGWMVLDYVDVVIHIFLADLRDYYALEDLWSDTPPLEE